MGSIKQDGQSDWDVNGRDFGGYYSRVEEKRRTIVIAKYNST
jgi:hypothetical protein